MRHAGYRVHVLGPGGRQEVDVGSPGKSGFPEPVGFLMTPGDLPPTIGGALHRGSQAASQIRQKVYTSRAMEGSFYRKGSVRGKRNSSSPCRTALGEASFIKALYPDCLREQELIDCSPQCTASAFDLVGIGGVSPRCVWGYPSRSTAEQGLARIEARVQEAVACAERVFEDLAQLSQRRG